MKLAFPLLAALVLAAPLMAQTLAELPKPAGLKAVSETPPSAIYSSSASVEKARDEAAKSFAAAGWVPYGEAGPTRYYKKGKALAQLMIGSTPPPENKTMLTYMVEKISADLPAPDGATDLRYTERQKRLGFATRQTPDEVAAAYRKLLAPGGWFTKMEKPEKDDFDQVMIYRHPTEGMIRLDMRPGPESLLVNVTYQTQKEVEAEEAKAAAQGKALKEKLAAAANAPQPEAVIPLPKGTTKNFPMKGGLAIKLSAGTAQGGAQAISKELQAQGWQEVPGGAEAKETGMINLSRGDQSITVVYMDPGMVPAEITIQAAGVALKPKP